MKKRVAALLIAVVMAVGMFAGCSKDKGTEPANNTPSNSSSNQSSSSNGESSSSNNAAGVEYYTDEDGNKYQKFDDVKLKMLVCWNGGFNTADDQYNNDVAKAIRDKIGVTVEFEGIMMSESEKLNMMFASGDMPDMVNAPYWGGTAGETGIIKKAGVEGRLIDIKDLVPKYPNISDAYDIGVISQKYLENDIDDPQFNGARYVLPTEVAGDIDDITNWAYGVFVRGDVPDALGVDVSTIKTSEQLYDFMVKARDYGFKDINGNSCIVATTFHNGWNYGDFAQSFGRKKLTGFSLDASGRVTLDKLDQSYVDSKLFIWKLVHEGILDVECFKTNDDRANEKVGNGTALFTCAQYQVTVDATLKTGLYNTNPEMRYIPVGPLNFAGGEPAVQTEQQGRSGSPVIIFPTTCSNIDAALTWLDYVNSKEGKKLIQYGFEGDTYELNAQGQPRMKAELAERYKADADSVTKELRQRGINYIQNRTYVAKKNTLWFGESDPFQADAANEYVKAYKEAKPVEQLPGYPIDALCAGWEGYQDWAEIANDGDIEAQYVDPAYFAATEEEARALLEAYQEYIRTFDNGATDRFLDYMTSVSTSRPDIAY